MLAFAATGEAPFGSGSAPTLAYRAVYRQVNLDRVPAEVRGLIDRCLAKDPGQRPTARDLMLAAAPDGSRTVTSARLSPVSQPAAGRPGRPQGRGQGRRPLVIASVVAGILAASATGGIAVAGCTSQTVAEHPTDCDRPVDVGVRRANRFRNGHPDRDYDRDADRDRDPGALRPIAARPRLSA